MAEPLRLRGRDDRARRAREAASLLDRVELPSSACGRSSAEFSGGPAPADRDRLRAGERAHLGDLLPDGAD